MLAAAKTELGGGDLGPGPLARGLPLLLEVGAEGGEVPRIVRQLLQRGRRPQHGGHQPGDQERPQEAAADAGEQQHDGAQQQHPDHRPEAEVGLRDGGSGADGHGQGPT
jgi:hypothetical protein